MTRKILADSNRAALREITESDWGDTPAIGVSRAVRYTQSSITVSKDTATSEEIRSDRMVSSIIETGASSGGDLNFEFSAGNQDGILQRVLQGAWSRPMTFDVWRGAVVEIGSNNTVRIGGGDYRSYFTVGRHIRTSGFVNPANNTYATITALAYTGGKTVITVSGTPFVAEGGSAFTSIRDANDVLLLKSTVVRFGTLDSRTLDTNGANAFADLVAAKQIVPGQSLFIDGVGYEVGTVTVSGTVAGETLTISDGEQVLALVVDEDFDIGVDDTATAANLAAAINKARVAGNLYVTATSALGVVTLTNLYKSGGSISGDAGEAASITINGVAAGDEVSINDGSTTEVFEADVDFIVGGSDAATAANLASAIEVAGLDLTVSVNGATITLISPNGGAVTSSDAEYEIVDFTATLTIVDFAGGNADFGGFYGVIAVTDDAIVVDRDLPATAAGTPITIKGSILRNPSVDTEIEEQSISLETTFTDVGQNFISDGMVDGTFELEVSAGAVITGSVKREGRATFRRARKLHASPYTALDAPATENVSATANVGALRAGGEILSTAIKSIKLTVDAPLRKQTAVSHKFPVGIKAGRLAVSLTIEAYFADGSNFDAFINHDTRDLVFPIIDPEQNTYQFTVPSFKITSDPIAPGGIDQDVMETMEGAAFRDAIKGCILQVDRFSSTFPIGF